MKQRSCHYLLLQTYPLLHQLIYYLMAKRGLDYYGILGLTKSASDSEIKEAYRYLSLQYNPVRNKDPNLQDLFCLVGEAYEVLTNPLLKSIYDHYGEAGLKKGTLTPVGWHSPWVYHGEPIKTFKKFFGTANPYADLMYCMRDQIAVFKAHKIEDVKVKEQPYERELDLTLEEVYRGTMKKLKIERQVFDDDNVTTHLQEKVICVNIKPGLPRDSRIVFQNVGDEGPGISPGDLVIITKDLPHDKFKRDGVNLHMEVSLDLYQSFEKLIVELNTLDDRVIRFAITEVIS
ncbi:unnamed protein product [Nezara viridula]|uniref:J domain-containing protein n=2 Tax=Nezara viridula TaxID=85310 RepID=A0A9P0E9F3_NEZVI|nr:unnamed protein product [Nezara viridula]